MNKKEKAAILVIDDNQNSANIIGDLLGKDGYLPIVYFNGKDALEYLDEEKPDLILLDVMMPGMDGYEVCHKIRMDEENNNIPIIFLTARLETEDLIKGFEVGAVDYIRKPVKSEELLIRIKTHVELKRSREEIVKLRSFLPICASCKKIRNDKGYWDNIEEYMHERLHLLFSHSLCPECVKKMYGDKVNMDDID